MIIPFPKKNWWSAREWFVDPTLFVIGHRPWKRMDRCRRPLDKIALWRGMPYTVIADDPRSGIHRFGEAVEAMIEKGIKFERWSTLLYNRLYPVALFTNERNARTFESLVRNAGSGVSSKM